MDFAPSEEQKLLRKTARDFLDNECPKSLVRELEASDLGYSPELWRKMAELGWLGLVLPEEYGGDGGSLLDLAILFEELGRATCPSPMFSTVALGAIPILEVGSDQQKRQLLPKVAKGEIILTLALTEPEADYEPRFIATQALPKKGGFIINGTKLFVQNAHIADYQLVVARTGEVDAAGKGLTVFIVEGRASGIRLTPLITMAADKQFEVGLWQVPSSRNEILGGLDAGWPLVETTLRRAAAIQCAEILGVAEAALHMTAEYAKTRMQFERPIGSFQAVQHRLADMLIDIEGIRWTAYQALWRLDKGLPAAREVAITEIWSSDACQRVAFGAQQIHGGLGMDLDYDLHFYFRRAKALELNLGAAPFHKRAIEAELGPLTTDRTGANRQEI